jgi:hypothetical protein
MGHDGATQVSRPIKRKRDGSIVLRLPSDGIDALVSAAADLESGLDPEAADQVRLFPRAYQNDDDEATFRDLTRQYLLESKRHALTVVSSLQESSRKGGISELVLSDEQLQALLGSLNDLRLVLGTMLEVTDEDQPASLLPPDAPNAAKVNAYLWFGAVQELLLELLLSELD